MDAKSLIQTLDNVSGDEFRADPESRVELLKAARGLQARLETKWETFTRISWQTSMLFNALMTAEDLKLFIHLDADGVGTPKSSEFLAKKASVPLELIQRLFRHLAAMLIIEEVSQDTWRSTPISQAYSSPEYSAGIRAIDWMFVPNFKFPHYMRQASYEVPSGPSKCAWPMAVNEKGGVWEYLSKHPEIHKEFNHLMVALSHNRPRAWDILPDETQRIQEWLAQDQGPVLVDLGGGNGQDIKRLIDTYPSQLKGTKNKLVLLDQATVINALPADLSPEIRAEQFDFFVQSPATHALFYHYSFIFHDWPDAECRKLLEQVKPAMVIEKSRVVIRDYVIPKTGADPQATAMDLLMMSMVGAKERTEDEWRDLIEGVEGFKVVKFHFQKGIPEGVVEVKRVT